MNIKTRPFPVPNYVIEEADVPRSFRLSDFDAEELSAKCDEFRAAVFKKAGKDDPRWAAPSASAPVEVTSEMVERACIAYVASARHHFDGSVPDTTHMRAALTAALKGKES